MRHHYSVRTPVVSFATADEMNVKSVHFAFSESTLLLASALEVKAALVLAIIRKYVVEGNTDDAFFSAVTPSELEVIQNFADFYMCVINTHTHEDHRDATFQYTNLNTGVGLTWVHLDD